MRRPPTVHGVPADFTDLVDDGRVYGRGLRWVENGVDFSQARNLITVAVALVLGAGNFKLSLGGFTLDGIGTATFGAIILYHILRMTPETAERPHPAE